MNNIYNDFAEKPILSYLKISANFVAANTFVLSHFVIPIMHKNPAR
jgi:hypothetical protein